GFLGGRPTLAGCHALGPADGAAIARRRILVGRPAMAAGVLATAANMRNRVMTRASRIVCVVLVAAGALLPITASAIPIPSPTLASILLPPPRGYAELASAPFHGQFTSSAYAASWGEQSGRPQAALNVAGRVDAYARFL